MTKNLKAIADLTSALKNVTDAANNAFAARVLYVYDPDSDKGSVATKLRRAESALREIRQIMETERDKLAHGGAA